MGFLPRFGIALAFNQTYDNEAMKWLLIPTALVMILSGCGSLPQLAIVTPTPVVAPTETPAPTPLPTSTPMMSSAPPTQIRCIMGEKDRSVLIVVRSTPALAEQSALNDVCTPGGRMGPTWIPQSLIAPMDDYTLICQGGISQTQVNASVWAIKSDPTAPGRAYNGCHAFSNVTYPVAP